MRGCYFHYVYFGVDCIPYKLLLHFLHYKTQLKKSTMKVNKFNLGQTSIKFV